MADDAGDRQQPGSQVIVFECGAAPDCGDRSIGSAREGAGVFALALVIEDLRFGGASWLVGEAQRSEQNSRSRLVQMKRVM